MSEVNTTSCDQRPDELVQNCNSTLSHLLDRHAPLKTNTILFRGILTRLLVKVAKRRRGKAGRVWRRTRLESDFNIYKTKKNHMAYLCNRARRDFHTNFINENCDQGSLSLRRTVRPSLIIAIARFLKIGKIRSDLDSVNLDLNEDQIVPQEFHLDVNNKLPELEILVEDNVLSLIQSSSVKSCLLNPMPTPL
ncbi:unnamed protein product, partial [Pocillopora meandrina]